MKFAHIADCHLGAWRQPELQKLNLLAFEKAIDTCIEQNVDFVLIAGDLFDTAIPSIDILKGTTNKLRQLKEKSIECFFVAGSHDFSPSGKSILSVLEKAGLCKNVDINTGKPIETDNMFIAGIDGKTRGLEINEIKNIKNIKNQINAKKDKDNKIKILLLHTTLKELLPAELKSLNLSSIALEELPDNFDYYALGHLHITKQIMHPRHSSKVIAYPGSLFPTSFSELESNTGNFYLVEYENDNENDKKDFKVKEIQIKLQEIVNLNINADNETPESLKEKILKELEKKNLKDKIITLRTEGTLKSGKLSDVNFKAITEFALKQGCYCFLQNTSKLTTKELSIHLSDISNLSIEQIEEKILCDMKKEKKIKNKDETKMKLLLRLFDKEKQEGETNATFAERITSKIVKSLKLEEKW